MENLSSAYVVLAFALAVGGGALGATLGAFHQRLCALISLGAGKAVVLSPHISQRD